MSKFKPEKKRDLERRVKEFDSKIKDSTNHMSKVVKNDAKAIADLSKKIKPGGTIEGAKAINESSQQAGKEVKKKYDQLGKTVENLVKKGGNLESEFDEREKYSKLNYAELTKASSSIEETPAAKKGLDRGRRVAQENIYNMNSLRGSVHRTIQRTRQRCQDTTSELKKTGLYVSGDNEKFYLDNQTKREGTQEIGEAIGNVQKEGKQEVKKDDLEGQEIPDKSAKKELCKDARKAIAKERLEAKLKAGQPLQDRKQVEVVDETSKKVGRNYGRPPLGTEGQNNVYNQKKTYQNE